MSKKLLKLKCPKCSHVNTKEAEMLEIIQCESCKNTFIASPDRVINVNEVKYKKPVISILLNIVATLSILGSIALFILIGDYIAIGGIGAAFIFYSAAKVIDLMNDISNSLKLKIQKNQEDN